MRRAAFCRIYAYANDVGTPRLGLIIPKRRVRSAVKRNRHKRVIRESFRLALNRLPAVDIVVQLTGDPAAADLRAELDDFWNQLVRDSDAQPLD